MSYNLLILLILDKILKITCIKKKSMLSLDWIDQSEGLSGSSKNPYLRSRACNDLKKLLAPAMDGCRRIRLSQISRAVFLDTVFEHPPT